MDAGSNQVSVQRALPGGSLRLSEVVSSGGVLVGTRVGTSEIDSFTVGLTVG